MNDPHTSLFNIVDLPGEILENIHSFMDHYTKKSWKETCRKFRVFSPVHSLKIDTRRCFDSSTGFQSLRLRQFSYLKEVNIDGIGSEMFSKFRNVTNVFSLEKVKKFSVSADYCSSKASDSTECILFLKNLSHLTDLKLERCNLGDGIKMISDLTSLTKLNLSGSMRAIPMTIFTRAPRRKGIGSGEFQNLIPTGPRPMATSLNCKPVKPEDISYLSTLTNLTDLTLRFNKLGTDSMRHLIHLSNLTRLDLNGNSIALDDVEYLTLLPNLTDLNLKHNHLVPENMLHRLSGLTTLLKLDLGYDNLGPGAMEFLSSLTGLLSLELSGNSVGSDGVAHLTTLANLEHLGLKSASMKSGQSIQSLTALPNLTSLDLEDNEFQHVDAKHFSVMTNLTSLNLWGCEILNEGAQYLAGLTNLTTLNLRTNNIGYSGAKHLAKMANLTHLNIGFNNLGCEGVQALTGLTSLKYLNMECNDLCYDGMECLTTLTNLTDLDVTNNSLGPRATLYLTGLTNLTSLSLERNDLGSDGIRHLTTLTNLTTLNLDTNRIGREGVEHLAPLIRLSNVNLKHNYVLDPSAPEQLRDQLVSLTHFDLLNRVLVPRHMEGTNTGEKKTTTERKTSSTLKSVMQ